MKLEKIKDEGDVERILSDLNRLANVEIEIGIPNKGFKNGNTLTPFGKAIINEYGATINVTDKMRAYLHTQGIHLRKDTTTITIPERSFMRASFDKNENKIETSIEKMLDEVISGSMSVDNMINIIGENCVRMIRDYIQSGIAPANAALTLSRKGGNTPLIDSGELINSIEWREV